MDNCPHNTESWSLLNLEAIFGTWGMILNLVKDKNLTPKPPTLVKEA